MNLDKFNEKFEEIGKKCGFDTCELKDLVTNATDLFAKMFDIDLNDDDVDAKVFVIDTDNEEKNDEPKKCKCGNLKKCDDTKKNCECNNEKKYKKSTCSNNGHITVRKNSEFSEREFVINDKFIYEAVTPGAQRDCYDVIVDRDIQTIFIRTKDYMKEQVDLPWYFVQMDTSIELPSDIDYDTLKYTLDDGVLRISGKMLEVKPKLTSRFNL